MRGALVTLAPHTPEQPHSSHNLRGLHLHDLVRNRTQLVHPDGAQFNYWYDGLNRPYYLFNNSSGGMAYISYHPIGAPMAMGHAGTTSYGYDGVQRPASLAHAFSGGAGSVVWTFGRNPAGQLSSVARDNDAFAWTRHYAVQRPYTTNGRNQYSATGPTTLAYDDNGNLISETTGDVTKAYGYDIENRLISASNGAALSYDPLGRLFAVSLGGNTTRFLYDGDALVAEYDSAGTMTKRYAHWVGADVPLVSYEGNSLANAAGRWLFADHQGSIIAATYPSESTAWVNTYDEYGIPGAGNTGRFQYTGQIWLPELGMYHYKARVYSPTLGRFLQTDPVGYQDQFNLYAYVGNDPVNRTDPTGRYTCTGNPRQCTAVRQALQRLEQASRSRNLTRSERTWAARILARYGAEGERNRIVVRFVSPLDMARGGGGAAHTSYDRATGESLITLPQAFPTLYRDFVQEQRSIGSTDSRLGRFSAQDERGNIIADEGKHAYDQQRLGRQVVPSEWHPPGQDFRSLVSRAFGSASIQDMRDDD